MTIILECGDKGWIAHWRERGIDVPLPFPAETKFDVVHDYLKAWYPIASIDEIKIKEGEAQPVIRS